MGQVIQFGKRQPKDRSPAKRPLPERPLQPDGKLPPSKRRRQKRSWLPKILGGMLLAGFLGLEFGPPLVGCSVKGNISPNTGERIYHVPGQEHYWETRINWLGGERWFCSENAAQAAGWRRAGA